METHFKLVSSHYYFQHFPCSSCESIVSFGISSRQPDEEGPGDEVDYEYEERALLAELEEEAIEELPQNVVDRYPILRRLQESRIRGVEKREDITVYLSNL